jgi:hypothetical protein
MHKVHAEWWMGTTFPAVCRDVAEDSLLQFLDHRATVKAKGHQWVQALDPDFLPRGNEWLSALLEHTSQSVW